MERVPDEFWGSLRAKILEQVKESKVFYNDAVLRTVPTRLRVVSSSFRDENQQPLLSYRYAGQPTAYLSDEYSVDSIAILRQLGTTDLSMIEFLSILEYDLNKATASRLRDTPFQSNWHTKMAALLQDALADSRYKATILSLPLIPLRNGDWIQSNLTRQTAFGYISTYFPTCRGVDIPTDLGMRLVDPKAVENKTWQSLLERLGVLQCEPSTVFASIKRTGTQLNYSVNTSTQHLKFVYLLHDELNAKTYFHFFSETGQKLDMETGRSTTWRYRPFLDIERVLPTPISASVVIGMKIPQDCKDMLHFLHPTYYEVLNDCETRHGTTGIAWIEKLLGIDDVPKLAARNKPNTVSSEVKHIVRHKSESLLGILRHDWKKVTTSSDWRKDFLGLDPHVLPLESAKRILLSSTYLPVPKLKELVEDLGLATGFGFIKQLDPMTDSDVLVWAFLSDLGVTISENIQVWTHLLKLAGSSDNISVQVVSKIYFGLQRHVSEQTIKDLK
jgi:hypothetical protein